MSYETIEAPAAKERLDGTDGRQYLDVRTVEEFDAGHVPGAFNVPLLHLTAMGMEPNSDFLDVVERHFAKDSRLVVGCKIGGRSMRACEMLAQAGYGGLANMDGGFSGRHDESGALLVEGWAGRGFPVTQTPVEDRN